MGRLAIVGLVLLLAPTLAGCVFEESLTVALRVAPGQTMRIENTRFIDGTIAVEPGATLILDGATLTIAQALVVHAGASVVARDSTLRFEGNFSRQNIESQGALDFTGTNILSLRGFELISGGATLEGGSIAAAHLALVTGELRSHGTDWTLDGTFGRTPTLIDVAGGGLRIENASLTMRNGQGLQVTAGDAHFQNVTMGGALNGNTFITNTGGDITLQNATFGIAGESRFLDAPFGVTRFIDAPIPSRQDVLLNAGPGVIEVAWTLTARAVSPPGNIPVGGIDVTLRSAHEPANAMTLVTDENGEARFIATQYVYGRGDTRSGNPHMLTANGGGKQGAMTGIVVEAPSTVDVPVFG